MNRTNIKILAASFAGAALLSWLLGTELHGRASAEELYCQAQAQLCESNNAANDNLVRLYISTIRDTQDKTDAGISERNGARIELAKLRASNQASQIELAAWNANQMKHQQERLHSLAKFNYIAIAGAFSAGMFSILLFITAPGWNARQ